MRFHGLSCNDDALDLLVTKDNIERRCLSEPGEDGDDVELSRHEQVSSRPRST